MGLRAFLGIALVGVMLVAAGCAATTSATGSNGGGQQVTIVGTDFRIEPGEITVQQGQKVTLTLQNKGATAHNIHIHELDVATPDVEPGKSATIEFTPQEAGTFDIMCEVPGHVDAGMTGKLIVQ